MRMRYTDSTYFRVVAAADPAATAGEGFCLNGT